ncbi:hypothetical protein BOX08_gp60 [Pseudoalteromonas phage BS5]|uniref:hypothetical protein n=1 Tax=Pseudoalteromonas phage BS5 TaxID=1874539 RepID=UPI0008198EC0|nr:hypothetical protein BOX08_gp60 [Pseudoalteromonas phage BS5]ANY29625.1 hypothetical protein [Pseudoalteromonas phage BS5]
MSDQTNQVVTELHLRTIEQYMAELAKSQAGQASALTELTSAVNRLVTRDEVRAEADKRIEGDLADLKKYKDYSEDIVKRSEKDQKFKDGLMQKVVYTLMASAVVGVLSYGGILIYDNAGSKNKTHKVNK